MKKLGLTFLTLSLFQVPAAMSQDMSQADVQCRAEAKELAIKSYQSCVSEARTAKLENIRKEYQEKLAELKKHYDSQIQDLKKSQSSTKSQTKAEPTVVLKKAKAEKSSRNQTASKKMAKDIITEGELEKSAPLRSSEDVTMNKMETEVNSVTGETENLQMVDPSLSQTEQP